MNLAIEDLLFGGGAEHVVTVPPEVLRPAGAAPAVAGPAPTTVVIRPLRLHDVQRIHKASQESEALTSVLMVQQALVQPRMTIEQVGQMHAGLVEFLVREINRVSGLSLRGDELSAAVQAPVARACYVLAREFGWTPE